MGKTKWRPALAWSAATLGLDLAAKAAVRSRLSPWEPLPVIDGFFDLTLVYNTGAAFSLGAGPNEPGQSWKMIGLALLSLLPFLYFYAKALPGDRVRLAALGLIWGGALGNIHDRLRWGAVVDFLDFQIRGCHWPAFNVADASICLGAGLLALSLLREKPAGQGKGDAP